RPDGDLAAVGEIVVAVGINGPVDSDAAGLIALPADAGVFHVRRRLPCVFRELTEIAAASTVVGVTTDVDTVTVAIDHVRGTSTLATNTPHACRAFVPALAAVVGVVGDDHLAAVLDETVAVCRRERPCVGANRYTLAVHASREDVQVRKV